MEWGELSLRRAEGAHQFHHGADVIRVRVCLLEGHPLAARYISELFGRDAQVRLMDYRNSGEQPGVPSEVPDVFLVDLRALGTDLGQLLRMVRLRYNQAKVILVGSEIEPATILRYLYMGIRGYVSFREVPYKLIGAVKAVGEGGFWIPSSILAKYIRQGEILQNHAARNPALSEREQQILELVVRRLTNKEIAEILHISERTVKFHVSNVFSKLQLHDRKSLIEGYARILLAT